MKGEIDPEDPLELVGVELPADEKSDQAMTECFIEEYLWLGWSENEIVETFRSPAYTGPHRVWQLKGEKYIREMIDQVIRKWRG